MRTLLLVLLLLFPGLARAQQPLTVFAALTDARGAILCSEPGPLTAAGSARGKAIAARAFR